MIKKQYKAAFRDGFRTVEGYGFTVRKYRMFVYRFTENSWSANEVTSSFCVLVRYAYTMKEAIKQATDILSQHSDEEIDSVIESAIASNGNPYPEGSDLQ